MTHREFTEACADRLVGIYKAAAEAALRKTNEDWACETFVEELLEQDSDEGSRSGTRRVLGEELYNELQEFKK